MNVKANEISNIKSVDTYYDRGTFYSSEVSSEYTASEEWGFVDVDGCECEYSLRTVVFNDRGELEVSLELEVVNCEMRRDRDHLTTRSYPDSWPVIEKFIARSEWPREIAGGGETPDERLRAVLDKYIDEHTTNTERD